MDYDDGKIKVRKSVREDVRYVADKMRTSDREEIWASNHLTPEEALKKGMDKSIYCRTIENGFPIAMFGICPQNILGNKANIWMLGTDDLNKIKVKFL